MRSMNKEDKTKIGYIIIGVCTVIFCLMGISAMALKKESYDPDSLCRDSIDAHTVIVIDKTDSFSPSQQRFLKNYMNRVKNKLKNFEKFSVFTLTEDSYAYPEPVFSKCNPGRGEDANGLYQNPKKIRMKFEKDFARPFKANISELLTKKKSSQTPIFEIIRELPSREDFGDEIEHRTLILVSDLMHHTREYSQYKGRIDYERFSVTQYAEEVSVQLNFVDVKIVYLYRDKLKHIQGNKHLVFWKQYFRDMGAEVTDVKNIR